MPKKSQKIKPTLPSGFRDYLPQEMILKQKMIDTIRSVYENYGFDPLDSSIIEKTEILTGGDESFSKNLYRVVNIKGNSTVSTDKLNELALRFDLTVPLARIMATNTNLPKPFKRYQMGYVFRGERAQKGRYRGFMQFDADTVGSNSILSDTEMLLLCHDTLQKLGVENFTLHINNRKLFDGLAEVAGFNQTNTKKQAVLRIIDKLDKVGWNKVATELKGKETESQTKIQLNQNQLQTVENFIKIKGTATQIISSAEKILKNSKTGKHGIQELKELINYLKNSHLKTNTWQLNLSIARGLGYYTGTVFETFLNDLPSIGSVFSGGRYDNLIEKFSANSLPAVGASIGLDRLFVALQELDKLKTKPTQTEVLILNLDQNLTHEYQKIAFQLRKNNINTQIYLGSNTNLKNQINFALKQQIPYMVFYGEEEHKNQSITLKHTPSKKQETIKLTQLNTYLKKIKI